MVSDSEIVVANIHGKRQLPLKDIFNKKLQIVEDEMIVQVIIKDKFLACPHLHIKRTKNEKIDYPLITMVALENNNNINVAFSGLCEYPFRSYSIENILNNDAIPVEQKLNNIINNLPDEVLNDLSGSSEYRKFVLHTILYEALEKFGKVN